MAAHRWFVAWIVGIASLAGPVCPGQVGESQTSGPQTAQSVLSQPIPMRVAEPDVILSVQFDGGTLAEFVESLRAAADPKPVNVVLQGDTGTIEIPAVQLRQVTPESAMEAVLPRTEAGMDVVRRGGQPIVSVSKLAYSRIQTQPTRRREGDQSRQDEPTQLQVYSVRELVDSGATTAAGLLDALKTALETQGGNVKPEVLHHEETGTLIVRGTPEQQDVVRQLLGAIRSSADRMRSRRDQLEKRFAPVRTMLQTEQYKLQVAQAQSTAAKKKLEQTKQLVGAGLAQQNDLDIAQQVAAQADLVVKSLQTKVQDLQAQLQELDGDDQLSGAPATSDFTIAINVADSDQANKLVHFFETLNSLFRATDARCSLEAMVLDSSSPFASRTVTVDVKFRGDEEAITRFRAAWDEFRKLAKLDSDDRDGD